jgi:hypothetical protein
MPRAFREQLCVITADREAVEADRPVKTARAGQAEGLVSLPPSLRQLKIGGPVIWRLHLLCSCFSGPQRVRAIETVGVSHLTQHSVENAIGRRDRKLILFSCLAFPFGLSIVKWSRLWPSPFIAAILVALGP